MFIESERREKEESREREGGHVHGKKVERK
jgi:hypothetical protein